MNKQATDWEKHLQYMYVAMGTYLEYIKIPTTQQ